MASFTLHMVSAPMNKILVPQKGLHEVQTVFCNKINMRKECFEPISLCRQGDISTLLGQVCMS